MFFKAATVSLALLLASRLLGLLRESTQAAAFGASGLSDVVVLMLSLPDYLTGLLASGALAYALLPTWAGQSIAQVASSQRWVAQRLLVGGCALAALLAGAALWAPIAVVGTLAPGLPNSAHSAAARALLWSAAALPAALVAALWATRLQHERDFVGMYAASLVVNTVVIGALFLVALTADNAWVTGQLDALGVGLLLAAAGRLVWLAWRQRRLAGSASGSETASAMPAPTVWLWAALSAGLPLALPFVARSMASSQGEGALTTFNYAWKLVELPLVLAIQLVASLSFGGIAAAFASAAADRDFGIQKALNQAFCLAWTLACAAAVALLVGSGALAQLLFGWGRMPEAALVHIGEWGAVGAWGLLAQAVLAVALVALAAQRRMGAAVVAFAVALAMLLAASLLGQWDGAALMWLLNALYAAVALACVAVATGGKTRVAIAWLAPRELVLPALWVGAAGLARAAGAWQFEASNRPAALVISAAAAMVVIASTAWVSPLLRSALRR